MTAATPADNARLIRLHRRRDLILIVCAIGVVALYILVGAAHGNVGFPLDDSWIHQVYARNLAQYGEWAFVHGIPSAGSTSPLYTLLLSIGHVLHIDDYLWAIAVDTAAFSLTALIGARIADHVFPMVRGAGWAAGILILLEWHIIWAAASGMDTIVFIALSVGLFALTIRELDDSAINSSVRAAFGRGALVGLIGALLTIARPEGIGLVGLCGLLIMIGRPQRTWRACLAWAIGVAVIWAIGVSPILALNYSIAGSLIPNTSAAKHAEYITYLSQPIIDRFIQMLSPLTASGVVLLIPGLLVALVQLIQRARVDRRMVVYLALIIWPIALIAVYAYWLPLPFQHGRYVIPAMPFIALITAPGALILWNGFRRYRFATTLLRVITIAGAVLVIVFAMNGAAVYSDDVGTIQSQMVAAAHWIAANLPPDAAIATHDIGAIGYYTPRPILDLAGLVSPEVVPIITDNPARFHLIQQRGIQYMMSAPGQLPVAPDDPHLCPLWTAPPAPIEIHMTVYQLAWDGHCPANTLPKAASGQ